MSVNDRFLTMFFEEARELLQTLESGLMDLEARQGERAHLDKTFRAAHSLKGAAGMVGLKAIGDFTHGVEALLDKIRAGELAVSSDLIGLLLAARDQLAGSVEAAAASQSFSFDERLRTRIDRRLRGEPDDQAGPSPSNPTKSPPPAEGPDSSFEPILKRYRLRFQPRRDLLRKGISPLDVLDELRRLGTATISPEIDQVPPLEELEPRECRLAWSIDLETTTDPLPLEEIHFLLGDRDQIAVKSTDPNQGESADSASRSISPPEATARAETVRIRVDAEQLDQMVGLAGELAVLTDSLQELGGLPWAGRWAGALESLGTVGRQLRDMALELRMVPVEDLFARFPRMVRDLAERSEKQIVLRLEGEETRLDRAIVDRLAEPMVHLIRNAIDHGLEPPDRREAEGKPRAGRITIRAGHEGDRVSLLIEDDGRGLDRAKIVRKGIAAGLIPPETSDDDPRAVNLIFEPGFSTRDSVSELSGRGVGLDVVRDTIRSLRGSISVESEKGRGTTFRLHLPLTLALIDGLLIETGGERYVIPLSQVEECVALESTEVAFSKNRHCLTVRGELIPVVPLRKFFKVEGPEPARQELLLTRRAGRRVGVAVETLVGRVSTVIQPLDEDCSGRGRFSGATILADGSVSLILDLAAVVSETRRTEQRKSAAHR